MIRKTLTILSLIEHHNEWWLTFHRGAFILLLLMLALVCMSVLFWIYLPLYRCHERKKLGLCVNCGYDL